jgi:hypothetical protein
MTSVFHFYRCVGLHSRIVNFAVEAHEDIDHSNVVCPICKTDDDLEEVATNVLVELD